MTNLHGNINKFIWQIITNKQFSLDVYSGKEKNNYFKDGFWKTEDVNGKCLTLIVIWNSNRC